MNVPKNLLYSKSHEWVKFLSDDKALIGLTDFAQHALGDIVFVGLPEEGDDITKDESLGDVESVKAVSEIYSPVTGSVSKVNEDAMDSPETINSSPYDTWLVEVSDIEDKEDLLSPEAYEDFCSQEG